MAYKFELKRFDAIAADVTAYDDCLADIVVMRFGCGLFIHLTESEARDLSAALALAADETAKATLADLQRSAIRVWHDAPRNE